MTAVALDPITLEVIKNALASVADEMALVVMRSAYSPVVRDTMDYSTALCDRDGELLAQGLTLAVQLGTFPTVMRHVREHFGDDIEPGDVFLANDPYGFGGQHLPDLYVIKPIFHEGVLEGYAATMAHHVDVGGLTPGSIAVHATEIFQEGLRLPLLKLYEGGRENTTVIRIIEKNTRQPVEVIGDLRAQVAACRAGERGLVEILKRYGVAESRRYIDELQVLSERLMRAEIAALPDGVYVFEDFIDGFGESPEPLRIAVELTVRGDEVWVDLEGHRAAGRGGAQLSRRHGQRRRLRRPSRHRRPRDPECRRLHAADPRERARGDDRQPCAPGGLRRAGRHRLPGLRRRHGRTCAGRAGQGGRARGGRPDTDRDRRLPGRPALRARRSDRRLLGRPRGARRARGRLEPARQPVQPAGRAARERPAAARARIRPRPRLRRPRPLPRRPRVRALATSCSPTTRC